jgi:hypothetical protein
LFICRSERRQETDKPPLKPNGSAGVQQRLEKKQTTFKKTLKKNFFATVSPLAWGVAWG